MHNRFHLAGVMGWPIAHSRSPKIHNYWLKLHGIEGAYAPFAIEPGKLGPALRAMATLGLAGCNLTIPHKEAALKLVDVVEDEAARIGAINCVVVGADGRLTGKNYDGFGFIAALRVAAPDWRAEAAPAAVIGAGGGARAIVAGLIDAGATEIRVFNRTRERAQALASDFGAAVRAHAWEERNAGLTGAGLLVNTTSQGMVGQPPLDDRPFRAAAFGRRQRHRLCAARNAAAGERAPRRPRRCRRARHANSSGAPGLSRLVRRDARGDPGAERLDRGDAVVTRPRRQSLRSALSCLR